MRRTRPSETEQHKTSSPPLPPPPPLLTPSSQHCLLSPATVFSWVYSAAHSYSTIPSISTLLPHLFLLVCTPSPSFFPPWGFSLRFITFSFFCTPVPPLRFTSSCTVFILLYFAVIICCQVRLPVFVTRARVYLKTILCCFPVYVRACVDDQYLVRASSVVTLRKHSSDGRFKRDVLKLFGRTKCPRYIFFFVVTTPASSTHVHFLSFFFC